MSFESLTFYDTLVPDYRKDGVTLYLNTGWSSSLNRYGRRLLTQEAVLVTTHGKCAAF